MLTASGARFGFRATLPHLIGVVIGVGCVAFVTGLGLGSLLETNPRFRMALLIASSLWILWMAWKLWHSEPCPKSSEGKPFTIFEAFIFQSVNPKIWAVAVAAMSYVEASSPLQVAFLLGACFSSINLGVCLFWSYTGSLLQALLSNPPHWRIFMRTMALALAGFSVLMFL